MPNFGQNTADRLPDLVAELLFSTAALIAQRGHAAGTDIDWQTKAVGVVGALRLAAFGTVAPFALGNRNQVDDTVYRATLAYLVATLGDAVEEWPGCSPEAQVRLWSAHATADEVIKALDGFHPRTSPSLATLHMRWLDRGLPAETLPRLIAEWKAAGAR